MGGVLARKSWREGGVKGNLHIQNLPITGKNVYRKVTGEF